MTPLDRPPKPLNDGMIASQVLVEKWQLLYRQSAQGVLGVLIAGALWSALMWQYSPQVKHDDIAMWLMALVVVCLMRFLLFVSYRRTRPMGDALLAWRMPFLATLLLISSVWGIGSLCVIPRDSTVLYLTTYVFTVGLSGAALAAYGVFVGIATLAIIVLLLPIVVVLIVSGVTFNVLLGIAGVCFFVVAMHALYVHNASLDRSFRLSHELREATRIAEHQARIDPLTGLRNRRAFVETANTVLSIARREDYQVSIMMIDVDNFKTVNDTYGHTGGDELLIELSERITASLRRSDLFGRFGGDEFAVLLPNTSATAARIVAEKLRLAASSTPIVIEGQAISTSLSIGIATGSEDEEFLLQRADTALYAAKRKGKACAVHFDDDEATQLPGTQAA